jgi:serine/threonine protein kinase
MGEVYLGHDMLLDRAVAIKFISSIEPDILTREQFLTEARAAARLQHPNVLTVYRVGEIQGRPFIISEYVRGQNLEHEKRPMPWQRVLELGIGLARGLAAAHRRGVLHRDIKPGNMLTERECKANDPQRGEGRADYGFRCGSIFGARGTDWLFVASSRWRTPLGQRLSFGESDCQLA